MEDDFAPTTRFRDLYRARDFDDDDDDDDDDEDDDDMNDLLELELITGSSSEGDILLLRGFKWSDFYSWAYGKIVWISADVVFDLTGINEIGFLTDYTYRRFLHVSGLCRMRRIRVKKKNLNTYSFTPAQKHTQPSRLTFYFSS
jgi:hypothetical protein